ncbi:thermonuclease family protein [Microvirga tunisiensis]|uniref:Uncharacterized protein n=1 Tax=Microvirga tunisiensis TaxID=2108360 RepID=A0A5N7MUK7_9HYPH|nr:hypothetical protein [Microvirga tunisiensis]MPR12230.1 hypothetical protein [Microvirga tunisiensis]MPR30159.1 hypothetical protein [Microvirga tunisiensis]
MAEDQTPSGESKLGLRSRSDIQDLRTTEPASRPANLTETSGVGNAPSVLPFLVDSPERRQLAKDLEKLLREEKIEEAEGRLSQAINLATLAVFLQDQLRTPSLLDELQALGLRDDYQSTALPAAAGQPVALSRDSSGATHAVPASDELAELKVARDREQQRADALSRDLATVAEELHALQALRAREATSAAVNAQQWAELKASFEKERERADAVTRDLAVMAEERHALQQLRGQDAVLVAYGRRELQELKEELLGRERQRNQAASAVHQTAEESQSSRSGEPIGMASLALSPGASSPGSLAVRAAAVQATTYRLHGVPNVVDAATLSLQGRTVHLVGVQTDGDAGSASELTKYLDGREVDCEPAGPTDVYRCQVDGMDLSTVVLFNGGGRAAPHAPPGLALAADRARSARVGIWSN